MVPLFLFACNRGIKMGRIIYKKDILPELKKKGYTTARLRKDRLLSESSIQFLREGKLLSFKNLAKICELLGCDIGDILVYVNDYADLDTVSDYRR